MKSRQSQHSKKIRAQKGFHACVKLPFLLQAKIETAAAPRRGEEGFTFTSLSDGRFLLTGSQAGAFLLRWSKGSSDPSNSGAGSVKPQNIDGNKKEKFRKLESVA
jgi:hypothetical protein